MKYKLRRAFMAALLVGSLICLYFLMTPGNFQPPVFAAQLQNTPQAKPPDVVDKQPVKENKKKEPVEKDKKVPQNKEAEDDKDWTG